jgi:hypothetical protein
MSDENPPKVIARVASAVPTRKVTAGVLAGAVTTIIVALINAYASKPLPSGVEGSMVTILTFLAGYITPPGVGEVVEEVEGGDDKP